MDSAELLVDLYGRIPQLVRSSLDALDSDHLAQQPAGGGNTVAWLVWHQARVQDHQVAELTAGKQLWETGKFADRFDMAPDPDDTGFGHTEEQVAGVRPDGHGALIEYADSVSQRMTAYVADLGPDALDEVVDKSYDPPVVLGVRLISVAGDCLQHLGQAAYLRGLLMARQ